jgi:leucyl/phenylalanyl-tRNA--protein transferase
VEEADRHGILAVGGDLSPERLLLAYQSGIFPWYSADEPIIWWSPNPRFVLYPHKLKVSKSMKQVLKKDVFRITFDQNFQEVMQNCQQAPRNGQAGTWITAEMIDGYCRLHDLGFAHSVEVWQAGVLVGGLYGVSLGKVFFGESMFAKVSNASKAGFITLVEKLMANDFRLIDSQVYTAHLESLGAESIARKIYLRELKENLKYATLQGNWGRILS